MENNWWEISFKKSKNIAYFSCLRGAIDHNFKTEEIEEKYHKICLQNWEEWYLKEFPRPNKGIGNAKPGEYQKKSVKTIKEL